MVLALAGSKFRSKSDPTISEFADCDKLGIWNALWAVRATFGCFMIGWEWRRYSDKRRRAAMRRSTDLELAGIPPISPTDSADQDLRWGTEVRGPMETRAPIPRTPGPIPGTDVPNTPLRGEEPPNASISPPPLPSLPPAHSAIPSSEPAPRRSARRREPSQPHTAADALFDRYVFPTF